LALWKTPKNLNLGCINFAHARPLPGQGQNVLIYLPPQT
jgi:hypothetical protein